ncbi:MAG: histidinol-phosphatase HisJ family protein [Clostridia bacterium]|nr:histidinol-phosphatase HisJ family protein [Clostridia bacterium]
MKYKFYSDSHVHSDNSPHSSDPIVKICEKAVALQFYSISILDNCECDLSTERDYEKSLKQSFFEVKKAQSSFKDQLNIFSGIEIGQPHRNKLFTLKALDVANFDYILGAVHRLRSLSDFFDMDYSENDVYEVLDTYFDEILEVIEFGYFDSLAHFNYPVKYITKHFGIKLDSDKICRKVRMILEKLAKAEKALEISLSLNLKGDGSILSNKNLLQEFKKAGGKYITIGSGAHDSTTLGQDLDEAFSLILDSGFDKFTIFKGRVPILLPILQEK